MSFVDVLMDVPTFYSHLLYDKTSPITRWLNLVFTLITNMQGNKLIKPVHPLSSQVMKLPSLRSSAVSVKPELSGSMISWRLFLTFLTGELLLLWSV